jgi:hypothetical protein
VSNENYNGELKPLVEQLQDYIIRNCYTLSYTLRKLNEQNIIDDNTIKNIFYKSHVKSMILDEKNNNKLADKILVENKTYLVDVISEYNTLNKTQVLSKIYEAFEPIQSNAKKILDALSSNRLFNEDMRQFLFVALSDWLRFNSLDDDAESRKKNGNYFMSLRNFKETIKSEFETRKNKLIELYRKDKTAFFKYLEVKQRYFNNYKYESKDIEKPFNLIKSQITNLHNMQSEKFKKTPSLLHYKKDTTKYIDDKSETDMSDNKTVIGGETPKSNRKFDAGMYKTKVPTGRDTYIPIKQSHLDDTKFEKDNVGGLPVSHIKREETTEELEIRELINTIKLMATTLQKIKGLSKFETSMSKFTLVEMFVTSLESILCFYMLKMYVGLTDQEKNNIGWVLYATKHFINIDGLLTPIYFDFLHLYGQSLNKLNLDFLDYDEVMSWEDKFFKNKMTKSDYDKLPTADVISKNRTTILKGVATSINSLHKKMVEAEIEKSKYDGSDEKISTKLLQNVLNATKNKIDFIAQENDITEKMINQSISQMEKLRDYNNKMMTAYIKTLPSKTIYYIHNIPKDVTEDWIFSHLPMQYIAYYMSEKAYEEGLDLLELRLLELQANKTYINPTQINDIAKLDSKKFKDVFGNNPMFDDDESNVEDDSFDVKFDDLDSED